MARREDDPRGDDPYQPDDTRSPTTYPDAPAPATAGGGKFAGMDPRQAWQQATQELGYGAGTPQDQATLQRIADYLGQNGLPGFKATGADTISIPGGGTVDVLTSGNQWWWGPEGGASDAAVGNRYAAPTFDQTPYSSQPWTGGSWTPPPLPSSLQQPYQAPQWSEQFTAPTAEEARATPGYQFTLDQGQQAIQRSAAAKGSLLNPGTLHALDRYSQGLADTTYGQSFDRAMQSYQSRYGAFMGNAQLGLQGRQQQGTEYLAQAGLGYQGFQNRYGQWADENQRTLNDYLTRRNAQQQTWNQYRDLSNAGLTANGQIPS